MLGIALNLRVILTVAAVVAAGIAGWTMNGWRLNAQIDRMVSEHSQALAKANADALAKYKAMEQKKQEALDEANRIAQRNARAAADARADANRLRDSLRTSAYGLSTASVPSLRNHTATLSAIFGECVAEIEGLAQAADGHALDSRTLMGAWPK
jgi:biopolymer transport protein ExbB/TolQ